MTVFEIEVFIEVSFAEVDVTTDVDVASLTPPTAVDVLAFAAPCSFFCLPGTIVERGFCPAFAALLVAAHLAFPCLFVGHWGNRGEDVVLLSAHEAVGRAVHAEQTEDGLLVVCPMTCRSVGELVIRAPDGEIGFVDNQGYRGQTEVGSHVGLEEVGSLSASCGSYCQERRKK